MKTSRREFVKATMAAGAGAAFPAIASAAEAPQNRSTAEHRANAEHVSTADAAEEFTRGVGVYPGAPEEFHGPVLLPSGPERRNLALHRPAYHSSSYDYNLTAQLVTDGIRDTRPPRWLSVTVDNRVLPMEEREVLVDHMASNTLDLTGSSPVVEMHLGGGEHPHTIDRIGLFVVVPDHMRLDDLRFTVSASEDNHEWRTLGSTGAPRPLSPENYPPDFVRGKHLLVPAIKFERPYAARFYRIELSYSTAQDDIRWGLGQVEFYNSGERVEAGGPYDFTSAWKAAGLDQEWVYVDLGAVCALEHVELHWISPPAEGKLQVSLDAEKWHDAAPLPAPDLARQVRLPAGTRGRYVRVWLQRPATADGYVLSEFEVYGSGGVRAMHQARQLAAREGRVDLSDAMWTLQRAGQTTATGTELAKPDIQAEGWLPATVPGTVLTSYINAGAVQEPNYGRNQLYISDSYFYSDFWYRTEFIAPHLTGERVWLDFGGINWKAEVYFNGGRLGRIEGGLQRARFDVTGKLRRDGANTLAVRIEKNATPGSVKQKTFESTGRNGGALGADNPTYHASIGWDWIPTIRGRNTGIWGGVSLHATGPVTLEDTFVTSTLPLPSTSHADVALGVTLVNHADTPVRGTLRGSFGELTFARAVSLDRSASITVTFNTQSHPQLRIQNPQLWWPAGYGEAHLYDVQFEFVPENASASDRTRFKAGVRQITASEDGGALRLWTNGRRIIAKGGNWGFSEALLRYGAREYDAALRYHREMNFNMVRNWVGQIGGDAFYEACDRHGLLVWQDFWLANPWDGPVPDDNALFLANARDLIKRIRMHPAVALYCGRNEGFPPPALESGLRNLLKELHPDLHYIPSSADGPVSGHGPYHAQPTSFYFRTADTKLHSEIGAPAIPSIESVRAMMPASALWPQGLEWGLHDFCLHGAQGGMSFLGHIEESYGGASSAEEWVELAQFLTYDTYRAMFEAQGQYRMGLLLWMSHPCWPSFVWQTYDYYLEPTAAYYACKKACGALHIQWDPVNEHVEVVNCSAGDQRGLVASLEVLDFSGKRVGAQTSFLDSTEDSISAPVKINYPAVLPDVHCLRLALTQNGRLLSSNFYLRGREQGNLRAIRELAKANVTVSTSRSRRGNIWLLQTELRNMSAWPALMVRLQAVRETHGDRILPAIFSDNYINLMPGEARTLTTELQHRDTRGERPLIKVSGFNVHPLTTPAATAKMDRTTAK